MIWGGGPLVCLKASLACNLYVALLQDHLLSFIDPMYLNKDDLLKEKKKKESNAFCYQIALGSIGNFCLAWSQSCIYETWWRGLFVYKILYLWISGCYRQLLKQHGSTYFQRSSNYTWNHCHDKLLQLAGLERILNNMWLLFHDFWDVNIH